MADPITTKIGDVSAYLDAVAHGFEGTRAEFGELLANSANYAQSAGSAASAAIAAAATATTKAGEATTAATAAQTAKTQTEAAASQALTDIGTAESGAISAIQTEGATQTANATAQAQAAATSANTASTKASEASASATTATTKATEAAASATSAANAASAAQGVLESIPEDYSDLSEDVDQLKADLADVSGETRNIFSASVGRYRGNTSNGNIESVPSSTTVFGASDMTPCEGGETYTVTFYNVDTSTVYVYWYNSSKEFIEYETKGATKTATFTAPSNARYIYTCIYKGGTGIPDITNAKIQIEKGEISTEYISPITAVDLKARADGESLSKTITNQNIVLMNNLYETVYQKRYAYHFGNPHLDGQTIPSQSIYDIERAGAMGFKVMEFNVHTTSDGKFVVGHGVSGKFGNEFFHINGDDISNVAINSVTLNYIKTYVRYVSGVEKFQTAPLTLEEALLCAKKYGITPAVQYVADAIPVLDAVCGQYNYIVNIYSSDRPSGFYGMLNSFLQISDKEELIAKCEASGLPYVVGINTSASGFDNFTESDWRELFNACHENGYRVSSAYINNPNLQHTLEQAGIDYIFSNYQINEIESGNLCNLRDNGNFSDFASEGTVSDSKLILTSGQTVKPKDTMPISLVTGGSLHVRFNGTIKITMGRYITIGYEFTSDGAEDMWFSTYFDNAEPTFTITAVNNTTIFDLTYKASAF